MACTVVECLECPIPASLFFFLLARTELYCTCTVIKELPDAQTGRPKRCTCSSLQDDYWEQPG
jgi:hypothetical protein